MKIIKLLLTIAFCLTLVGLVLAADKDGKSIKKIQSVMIGPHQPIESKYHYIGRLWNRVTNFGKAADDAYENRTPACDWPNTPAQYPTDEGDFPSTGRSGNSYLYRGSLWLTGLVDGVPHVSQPEGDGEYQPIDVIHVNCPGDRAFFETSTKYYDVNVPGAGGHFPLGVEVTEKTYSWPESYRYDFIIYEYTIKNVGIDTDNDGYPDTPRDLQDFYFTYRMDGDVSKLSDWAAEGYYSNQDDLAGINSSWSFLEKFPEWEKVDHGLTEENADTTLMFMFDADNPSVPSEYKDPVTGVFEPNDLGNPGPTGALQTPGFLGFKVLKTVPPTFKVSKFRTGHIQNDPDTDLQAYERMVAPSPGEDPYEQQGPSGVVVNPGTGALFPHDYRGFLTIGPIQDFKAGDSVIVTAALGVGADPDSGGIYSLMHLVNSMKIAQRIVDADYQWNLPVPPQPALNVIPYEESETDKGMAITWNDASEHMQDTTIVRFAAYVIMKASEKNADQSWNYDTLAIYQKNDDGSWKNRPPVRSTDPLIYEYRDSDVINGFIYSYAVEGMGTSDLPGLESISAGPASRQLSPSNVPGTSLDDIKVVPNPYLGSVIWNNPSPGDANPWEHKLQFTNLPTDATIKIFTLDGDFVDEIKAGQNVTRTPSGTGVAEWDLISRNNQEVAPGIYLYVVQSPSLGEKVGKFVIVR